MKRAGEKRREETGQMRAGERRGEEKIGRLKKESNFFGFLGTESPTSAV